MKFRHILILIVLFVYSCTNKKSNNFVLPSGAVPVVYCGYIIIPASVENVKGNFILDK